VLEPGDVAEILGLAVVMLCHRDLLLNLAVIARSAATKQSPFGEARLAGDCFAALAMTIR
jgi:hypothetical protein